MVRNGRSFRSLAINFLHTTFLILLSDYCIFCAVVWHTQLHCRTIGLSDYWTSCAVVRQTYHIVGLLGCRTSELSDYWVVQLSDYPVVRHFPVSVGLLGCWTTGLTWGNGKYATMHPYWMIINNNQLDNITITKTNQYLRLSGQS